MDWRINYITKCGQISSWNWSGSELQNCDIQEHKTLKTRAGTDYKFQGRTMPMLTISNEFDIKLSWALPVQCYLHLVLWGIEICLGLLWNWHNFSCLTKTPDQYQSLLSKLTDARLETEIDNWPIFLELCGIEFQSFQYHCQQNNSQHQLKYTTIAVGVALPYSTFSFRLFSQIFFTSIITIP